LLDGTFLFLDEILFATAPFDRITAQVGVDVGVES
jgi:hypothetical protein